MANFSLRCADSYPDFDYSINVKELLSTESNYIEMTLNKYELTHSSLEDMISNIRVWFESQTHLPKGHLYDQLIFTMLVRTKFSVEQCKQRLDKYFIARVQIPDLLGGWEPLPSGMEKCLSQGNWVILPKKTAANNRVLILRCSTKDDVNLASVINVSCFNAEYRNYNDTNDGEEFVFDLRNFTVQSIVQLPPAHINKIVYYCLNCHARKIKGIHIINLPSFAQPLLSFAKKVMNPKLLSTLHLYDNFEDIFNQLPRDLFPKDMGGTADITSKEITDNWYKTLTSDQWSKYYKIREESIEEAKKMSRTTYNHSFGIEGYFRKLELD